MKVRLLRVLHQHGVRDTPKLLADLADEVDSIANDAWMDNDEALALLPHLNGVQSLGQWVRKFGIRRRTSVQWTADVLAAVAQGDRRRRKVES